MNYLLLSIIAGISTGFMYGFVALSFTSIYNCSKIVNFALGDVGMLAAFVASIMIFTGGKPIGLGVLAVIGVSAAAGLAMKYILVDPLRKRQSPSISIVIMTFGVGMIMSASVGIGTSYGYFPTRMVFGVEPVMLGSIPISTQYMALLAITMLVGIGYWVFLYRTPFGMKVRLVGSDRDMASLLGINAMRAEALAWAIACAIAGLAGLLLAPLMLSSAHMGIDLLLYGFIAAALGGLGNPLGAVVGGLTLGIVTTLFSSYISSSNVQLFTFVVLLIVLAVKPEGFIRGE